MLLALLSHRPGTVTNFQPTDSAGSASAIAALCTGLVVSPVQTDCWASSDGGTAGSITHVHTVDANATDILGIWYDCAVNSGVSWNAGNWVVKLNVTTANTNLTWADVFICRVNSSYVNQQTIGSAQVMGISLATTGVKTAPTISGASTSPNAGDRIVVVLAFNNALATNQNFSYKNDQLITTPYTH